MLIWLPIALLTGVAVLAVLLPLGSRSKARDEGGDVAFYLARLTEIEGDAARGLIEPQDAEAAQFEAARFLLAADRSVRDARDGTVFLGRRRGRGLIGLGLVPAVVVGFDGWWYVVVLGDRSVPESLGLGCIRRRSPSQR